MQEGKKHDHRIGSYLCSAKHKFITARTNFRRLTQNVPGLEAGPNQMKTNAG